MDKTWSCSSSVLLRQGCHKSQLHAAFNGIHMRKIPLACCKAPGVYLACYCQGSARLSACSAADCPFWLIPEVPEVPFPTISQSSYHKNPFRKDPRFSESSLLHLYSILRIRIPSKPNSVRGPTAKICRSLNPKPEALIPKHQTLTLT